MLSTICLLMILVGNPEKIENSNVVKDIKLPEYYNKYDKYSKDRILIKCNEHGCRISKNGVVIKDRGFKYGN